MAPSKSLATNSFGHRSAEKGGEDDESDGGESESGALRLDLPVVLGAHKQAQHIRLIPTPIHTV